MLLEHMSRMSYMVAGLERRKKLYDMQHLIQRQT